MGNDITISISRNLNEISLSLIKISDLYENNLNSVKMICLLDESLRSQFEEISSIENVDKKIAELLQELYANGKLTDKNVANELQKIRNEDGNDN